MSKLGLPKIKLDQEPVLREKMLFAATLLTLLVFFINSFWSPHMGRMKLLRAELGSLRQEAEAVKKLIEAAHAQLSKQESEPVAAPQLDERIRAMLERRVADPADEINFVVEVMGGRALGGRLRVEDIKVGERADRGTYLAVPVGVDLAGSYTGVQGYLEALEDLDRPLAVKSFSLRGEDGSDLKARIEAELYVVKR